jgi:hypothetical protein
MFSSFWNTVQWKKFKNAVILTAIHHQQNPLEPMSTIYHEVKLFIMLSINVHSYVQQTDTLLMKQPFVHLLLAYPSTHSHSHTSSLIHSLKLTHTNTKLTSRSSSFISCRNFSKCGIQFKVLISS